MSKISNIIGPGNFEIIRTQIALILATEFAEQRVKNQAVIDDTEATPAEKEVSQLNLDSIPTEVWEERFVRPQPGEYPLVNVVLTNVPLTDGTSHSVQLTEDKYQIEVYQNAITTDDGGGDYLATIKLHRLLSIIRGILMDRNYVRLGFDTAPFIIGSRRCEDIVIAQPNFGANDSNYSIHGKIDLLVKTNEEVEDITGVPLLISNTDNTIKLLEKENGYTWTIDNTP